MDWWQTLATAGITAAGTVAAAALAPSSSPPNPAYPAPSATQTPKPATGFPTWIWFALGGAGLFLVWKLAK